MNSECTAGEPCGRGIWDMLRTVQTELGVMAQWDLFLYLYVFGEQHYE